MRIYCNLVNGTEVIPDEEGVEVLDTSSAEAEALKAIEEMRHESGAEPRDWTGWRMAVVDQSGELMFWVDLDHG